MVPARGFAAAWLGAGALLLAAAGCGDNPVQVTVGTIQVAVTTNGGDQDRDGYRIFIDNVAAESVGVSASSAFHGLTGGEHSVELRDVAANCTVAGANPRTVIVVVGQAAAVTFTIQCLTTGVRVVVTTAGIDLDANGYAVVVDTGPPVSIGISATTTVTYLAAGQHSVSLNGLAGNCSVSPALPHTLSLAIGQVATDSLAVTCVATTGVLEVSAATTGIDANPSGYTFTLDNDPARALAVNGLVRVSGLGPGDHSLTVNGAPANCAVGGGNPRTVTITAGGVTRDTARTTVAVSCVATTGVLEVTAVTTGLDAPSGGYTLAVDNTTQALPVNGTLRIPNLSPGDHSVTINGSPANCTIAGSNPRTVTITAGGATRDTTRTTAAVSCVATTGVLEITAPTTGLDVDPNGYAVGVDGGGAQALATAGVVRVPGLSPGSHEVRLAGIEANCTVAGSNPRTVSITAGGTTRDTTQTSFDVACLATTGAVEITAATAGGDPDSQYTVLVFNSSYYNSAIIASGGSATIFNVPVGDYLVGLGGVAANCTVGAPNPATVSVTAGTVTRDTARTSFAVSCVATTGVLRVTSATTGSDPDTNGYTVRVLGIDVDRTAPVSANGAATIPGVFAGSYIVTLRDETSNCTVAGGDSRISTVTVGDTTTIAFDVSCAAARDLAVTLNGDIYRVKENGTGLVALAISAAPDYDPTWSVGGASIAFVSLRNGNPEIYVMNPDGSGQTRLTTNVVADLHPSVSPDGTRIAYASNTGGNFDIWVMNADGTNPVRLTTDANDDFDPAWSPDGQQIAFTSQRAGNAEIYVMATDGSGQARLTFDGGNIQPAWSPDGTMLAFSHQMYCDYLLCYYEPTITTTSGVLVARLPMGSASGEDPAWSPDGSWIAFGATFVACDYYSCYISSRTVNLVRADGTGLTTIVGNESAQPAWRH